MKPPNSSSNSRSSNKKKLWLFIISTIILAVIVIVCLVVLLMMHNQIQKLKKTDESNDVKVTTRVTTASPSPSTAPADSNEDPRLASEKDGYVLLLQRQKPFSMDWDRVWEEYKWGFEADIKGLKEYWIGLEQMYRLTNNEAKTYKLRFDIKFKDTHNWIEYDKFKIGPESERYIINFGLRISGTLPDIYPIECKHLYSKGTNRYFKTTRNEKFITKDRDVRQFECEDVRVDGKVGRANNYKHGWWMCEECCLSHVNHNNHVASCSTQAYKEPFYNSSLFVRHPFDFVRMSMKEV